LARSVVTIIDRFRLDDKIAVITGASSDLGRGFAQALSDAGAAVGVCSPTFVRRTDPTPRPI